MSDARSGVGVALVVGALLIASCGANGSTSVNSSEPTVPAATSIGSGTAPTVGTSSEAGPTTSAGPMIDTEGAAATTAVPAIAVAPTDVVATVAPCDAASWTTDVAGRATLVREPVAAGPVPVVVAIHGYKGTPEGLEYYSELSTALSGDAPAIVLYPSGTPLDLGFGWDSGAGRFATSGVDDVAVVQQVIDFALTLPCADAARVVIAGESNGGGMALRAVCDERLAGRVAALWLVNAAVDDGVLAHCGVATPPVPVLATAGLVDEVVPFDGSRQPFLSVDSWFATVAQRVAGCADAPATTGAVGPAVEVRSAGGCGGACAALYVVADGPHTWPGSFEGVNGAVPGSFELTELLRRVVDGTVLPCGVG